MAWYSIMLLIEFRKRVITVGRIFLKKEGISRVFFFFSLALLFVFLFSFTLFSEEPIIANIGLYAVDMSLLFFFCALYKFYRMITL